MLKTAVKMGVKLNLDKLDLQIIHEMIDNAEFHADLGKAIRFRGHYSCAH